MLTTLQIILAGVGVLFIVLIVGYNLWQERRYRKEASRMFSSRREDILLGESVRTDPRGGTVSVEGAFDDLGRDEASAPPPSRSVSRGREDFDPVSALDERGGRAGQPASAIDEPVPGPMDLGVFSPEPASKPPPPEAARVEVVATPPETPAFAPPSPPAVPPRFEPESPLDDEIEYVARLRFTKPVFVSYTGLMDRLRKVGKAVRAMGRRADGGWDTLSGHPAIAYEALEFGVLLADRGGALTPEQMEQFCRALYDFAAEEGGAVSCPDKHRALEKARDLDLFCVDVDVLIGLNVVARDTRPFNGGEIERLAIAAGLRLKGDGAYYLEDEDGLPLFSVANQEEQPFRQGGTDTHGLSLIFDLPRVRDGINVFDRMTALGRQLADQLGGRLVDDNGRIVTQDSLQKDRKRLNDYFARMQARGIPAGGERALRLFA